MKHQETQLPTAPEVKKQDAQTAQKENQEKLKKDVQRLFELASDLKTEIEKEHSEQTLSLHLLKNTEEAEMLARQIKALARG